MGRLVPKWCKLASILLHTTLCIGLYPTMAPCLEGMGVRIKHITYMHEAHQLDVDRCQLRW
jgi:hypothetical protein